MQQHNFVLDFLLLAHFFAYYNNVNKLIVTVSSLSLILG